jgi:hypothetical protein
LAARFALAFCDGDSLVCRLPVGAVLFQEALRLADFDEDLAMRQVRVSGR